MLIGFIGDMHGRAFHALAAIVTLQEKLGRPLDLLIQVGDFGYPDMERADEATRLHAAADPSERELSWLIRPHGGTERKLERLERTLAGVQVRAEGDEGELNSLLDAAGARAKALKRIRDRIARPILFLRGNHEDFEWLSGLEVDPSTRTAAADPFDLFHYVRDGTLITVDRFRIAFLGGVEESRDDAAIDRNAARSLLERGSGSFDLLVSHQGPYRSYTGYRGSVYGSPIISEILDGTRPAFHVFGHAHQLIGPKSFGSVYTTILGLDGLVGSPLWRSGNSGLRTGCLGVLDTSTSKLRAVTDPWLSEFPTPFDFDEWATSALSATAD
jgi:hypothetical protein